MKKSICKLIYGYMAVTYAMLFLGVLVSDTLYKDNARILCASSVPRVFVPCSTPRCILSFLPQRSRMEKHSARSCLRSGIRQARAQP